MATRYWVGGDGTWTGTTHWSATSALTFTASCVGTALTTTGSPALVAGMTVWSNNNTSLGTIVSGAGNAWVVSVGGTYTSQEMTAATVGASAPTTADDVIFNTTSSLVSYTVTSAASSQNCKTLTMDGPSTGILTFAGTNNVNPNGTNSVLTINTPSTINWTNTGIIQGTGTGTLTLNTNGCILASGITINGPTTIGLSSDFIITGTCTFSSGTFSINSYTLSVNNFTIGSGITHTLNFGTGSVYVTGTSYSTSSETGLSFVGTPVINMTYTGTSPVTISTGTAPTLAQCPTFNISCTGGATVTLPTFANDINMTGFVGTISATNIITVYGSLTLSATTTVTSTTNAIVLASTSGNKTITTNGVTINRPITVQCGGSITYTMNDSITMGNIAARVFTITTGNFDLNKNTLSTISFVTATGTKNLKFNGGSIYIFGSGGTAFNNAVPGGFATSAGPNGNGYIYMTSASAKTFVGGGTTFAASLIQAGSGTLTVTGNNTFAGSLKNTTQPAPITFTSSTTNTFNTDIKLKGTAGSLIVLTSTVAGTAATLSHTGSNVSCDYISVKDNTAAGTVPFYAGSHSVIVSNATNWSNRPPPSANTEFLTLFT